MPPRVNGTGRSPDPACNILPAAHLRIGAKGGNSPLPGPRLGQGRRRCRKPDRLLLHVASQQQAPPVHRSPVHRRPISGPEARGRRGDTHARTPPPPAAAAAATECSLLIGGALRRKSPFPAPPLAGRAFGSMFKSGGVRGIVTQAGREGESSVGGACCRKGRSYRTSTSIQLLNPPPGFCPRLALPWTLARRGLARLLLVCALRLPPPWGSGGGGQPIAAGT